MKNSLRWLYFGLLLLSVNLVHAEGECPLGMFPTNPSGAQGPVGCAPIPGYAQPQQAHQQQPPPQWVRRWGAIATDSVKGVLGTATGLSSKSEAQQESMADCHAKGGSPCKFEIAYDNECAAMVVGNKGYSINTGDTADAANQLAMKTCSADGDPKCHVYYSACSLPVRTQ
jgi:hypothetical protein